MGYKDKFAISQSAIRDWKEMPPQEWYNAWVLKQRENKRGASLDFGSLIDTLAFTPKAFEKRFVVSTVKKPSDKATLICEKVLARIIELNDNATKLNSELEKGQAPIPFKELDLESNPEIVKEFCVELEHYAAKPEQGFNDIVKKGKEYFEFIKGIGNKTVITEEQMADATAIVEILKSDKVSRGFFFPKKGCEVIYQQQIFINYPVDGYENLEFIPLKGIPDIIHFNHSRKEVREVDLKFTQDAFLFADYNGPMRKFDYPTQHSLYDHLIREWLKEYKKGEYSDYSVQNPLNLVIDNKTKVPYLYEYSPIDLHIKRKGMPNTNLKGWEEILDEISFHLDCSDWSRPKEHIKNGKIFINIFKR